MPAKKKPLAPRAPAGARPPAGKPLVIVVGKGYGIVSTGPAK